MESFIIATTHKDVNSPGGKRTRIWSGVAEDERHALSMLGMRGAKVMQKEPDAMEIARRNGIKEGGYKQL